MGNQTSQFTLLIEDHTVGTRRATIIDLSRAENREFVPVARNGEVEALVVVILVGVIVGIGAFLVQLVSGVLGGADFAGAVGVGATGVVGSEGTAHEESGGGEELD